MANSCIAGNVFSKYGQAFGVGIQEKWLNPPMLVSQLNLQVQHAFTNAVEPEMPRLNNARMYGADGDFVDFFPFNRIIVVVSGNVFGIIISKNICFVLIVGMIPDHPQPRMPLGTNAVLFSDLPFKHVEWLALSTH